MAVDVLETLQGRGQKVGVITHVAGMIEKIACPSARREAGRRSLEAAMGTVLAHPSPRSLG